MDINGLREKIDAIDDEVVRLFCERMRVSADIARYKEQNGLDVYDPEREQSKLENVLGKTDEEFRVYMRGLYEKIFDLSREYQHFTINNRQ